MLDFGKLLQRADARKFQLPPRILERAAVGRAGVHAHAGRRSLGIDRPGRHDRRDFLRRMCLARPSPGLVQPDFRHLFVERGNLLAYRVDLRYRLFHICRDAPDFGVCAAAFRRVQRGAFLKWPVVEYFVGTAPAEPL